MKNRMTSIAALGVAIVAMLAVALVPISAQLANSGAPNAKGAPGAAAKGGGKGGGKGKGKATGGPIQHIGTVDFGGQPDFGGPGMWSVPYITNMSDRITAGGLETCQQFPMGAGGNTTSCAPFTALGKEVFAGRRKTDSATDPEGFCLPPGVPRMMYTPYPMKMIQEPNMVTFVFEGGSHIWRPVPIGPKGFLQHERDPNPTYLGDSFGWWEGDTLVIDTIGFNDRTWLDFAGHPHGEKLHVIERFTRLDTLTLQHVAIIEDPDYYTQPWTVTITTGYQPQGKMLEYICQENERDSKHQLEQLQKLGISRESIK
ncbi:MAG: hypothetical protein ABI824_12050 [Acidobacteriota bacterium]